MKSFFKKIIEYGDCMVLIFKKYATFLIFQLLFFGFLHIKASGLAQKGAHVAKAFAKEIVYDVSTNKTRLAKEGLKWGGVSGVWYLGADQLKNVSHGNYKIPEDVAESVRKEIKLSEESKIIPITKSYLNNKNNPENRWLTNGKGFWGNVAGLFSSSDLYIDKHQNLRIAPELVEKVHNKDPQAIAQLHKKLQDEIHRSQSYFDYKTYAACAADTAMLTSFFMINPVVKSLQAFTKLKSSSTVLSYISSAAGNKAIREHRKDFK